MKTAFVYHRYSTEMQRDGYTLQAQRSITKELARKYDCKIIQVYEDEAISGATIDKRPAMLQLLEDLPKLRPTYLIATDQDRISRNNDFWIIKNTLAKSGTSIITEKEGIIDQSDITKDALSDMLAVFSKLERKMIGRRISRGATEKIKQGLYFGGKPYGYHIKDGKLLVNESEAKLVRQLFSMAADGMPITTIARYFNDRNIKTPKGAIFRVGTLTRILTNPIYIGKLRYNGSLIKGKHKPIIDEVTFKRVNSLISQRRIKNRTRPAKYLLTGYLKCGVCGSNMSASKGYYTNVRNGKILNEYHGYRCKGVVTGHCNVKIIGKIEKYIFDQIAEKIKMLKLNITEGLELFVDKNSNIKKKENLQNDIRDIDSRMSKLLDSYLDGVTDFEIYKKKNNELKLAKEHLLKELEEFSEDDLLLKIYEHVQNFNADDVFTNLDFGAKRELLSIFINKIVVNKSGGQGRRDYLDRINIYWNI